MRHLSFATGLSGVALVVLAAGCAGPSASLTSGSDAAASVRASDLSGTWHGTLGWVGASLYEDEARITLRIEEDGTFTATVTPNRGTNNLAKPSTLSGTIATRGNRVTLRNSEGPWPWVTLVRSADTLYGVAADPAALANVMLKIERDGSKG